MIFTGDIFLIGGSEIRPAGLNPHMYLKSGPFLDISSIRQSIFFFKLYYPPLVFSVELIFHAPGGAHK